MTLIGTDPINYNLQEDYEHTMHQHYADTAGTRRQK